MADSALTQEIDAQEGVRPVPYKDTRGLWSIGTGRCLETNPLTGAEWKYLLDHNLLTVSISPEGADWLKQAALDAIGAYLAPRLFWFTALAPARQDALIDMAFQMGTVAVLGFKDMLAAIAAGDWQTAYYQALHKADGSPSDWAKETPERAQQVAQQLRDGIYPQEVTT